MMKTAALNLLAKQGFSVIPLKQDKRPYLDSWREFQTRQPTEEEVEQWWSQWPDANIGIVTGAVSGLVVVDADGIEGLQWMREHLPKTGVYAQTGKGWHAYFKHPGGKISGKVRLAPEIDIRADGNYVVAPPSVHASGFVYRWEFPPGFDGFNELADFPKQDNADINLAGVKPLTTLAPVPKGQRNDTLASLVGKWITVNKLSIDECMLMAQAWSKTLDMPLPISEVERTVRSIFETEARNHPGDGAPEVVVVPESESEQTACTFPESVLHPGGLMEQLMDYMEQSSAVSHPVFNLAGSIAAVGTLAGQKYMTETGLRTNFYCLAIGYSGAGKDAPQAAIPQVFNRASQSAAACLAGNGATSEAAILRWVSNESRARALYLLDEIGLLLAAMKRPQSPAAEIPSLLMKLFSGADRSFSRQYADQNANIDVRWHHVSLYGASTPDRFWESMSMGETTDGFLARCLIFESRHDVERPKKETYQQVPKILIDAVTKLANVTPEMATEGNLCNIPAPKKIYKTPEAAEFFEPWDDKYHELRNKYLKTNEALSSIYGRAAEHAHKLALTHAISLQGPEISTVGLVSVQWACALVDALLTNTAAQIENNIAESDFQKFTQRALKAIRAYVSTHKNKPGAPRWYIENFLKGQDSIVVDRVLKKLIGSGRLVEQQWQGKNGPSTTLFCLARVNDEND